MDASIQPRDLAVGINIVVNVFKMSCSYTCITNKLSSLRTGKRNGLIDCPNPTDVPVSQI